MEVGEEDGFHHHKVPTLTLTLTPTLDGFHPHKVLALTLTLTLTLDGYLHPSTVPALSLPTHPTD